ncbi:medium-chain acyl-CoA ligase ACSF2, mitochondrial-like [Phlebotomus argentipes]|uniref:medium-chain acyl-CoA ligase ACSF2, mitochondrial-like n=1 Tax=Phlebotomus argentipes TaxID=94469 RepID=UPI0028931672|nr:medium-chain acyl-CoA ligase ACSF2, mitochondrial-like [Phlebotomus argentipes]
MVISSLRNSLKLIKLPQFVASIREKSTTASELSYFHNNGSQPLIYRTIGQELRRVASEYGDLEAIVAPEEQKRLTFDQIRTEADNLAAGFIDLGLQRGDRVALLAPNVISWPIIFFAAARAGLILVALNPAFEPSELEYCLQKVGVKALVTSEIFRNRPFYEILQQILPELQESSFGKLSCEKIPSLTHVIMDTRCDLRGVLKLSDVASRASTDRVEKIESIQNTISPDSGCSILFSSGTTGRPKAALLKHLAFINNGAKVGRNMKVFKKRICVPTPFFHVYGAITSITLGLMNQATIVLPSPVYNVEKTLLTIRDHNCSVIYGTPTMHIDLVRKQREMKLDVKVDLALVGGALCPPQVMEDLTNVLGVKVTRNVYGTTENSSVSFGKYKDGEVLDDKESVGQVHDHVEAKVVDQEGNMVPFGDPGELCVRGYFTMIRYWGDEEKTKEILGHDGWLKTGDQFILQPNGYGKVVGRLKDMIIRGGENVFPKEIENLLATSPKIAEVYIVGVPDERLGEELCAFVKLRDGNLSYTIDELKEFCRGKIAYFKIPRYLRIIEEFPKTVSGKIQKFKLQEQFKVDCSGK